MRLGTTVQDFASAMEQISPIVKNWKAHLARKAAIWDKLAEAASSFKAGSKALPKLLSVLDARAQESGQLRALNAELSKKLQTERSEKENTEKQHNNALQKLQRRVQHLENDLDTARSKRTELKEIIDNLNEAQTGNAAEKNALRGELLAEIADLKKQLAVANVRQSKEEINRQLAEAAVGDSKAAHEVLQQRVAALRKQLSDEQRDREAITKTAEIAARQKDMAVQSALTEVGCCCV